MPIKLGWSRGVAALGAVSLLVLLAAQFQLTPPLPPPPPVSTKAGDPSSSTQGESPSGPVPSAEGRPSTLLGEGCVDAILGTFVRSPGFYTKRSSPDNSWVIVFLRSAAALRQRPRQCRLEIVLWVDPGTESRLQALASSLNVTLISVSNATHGALLSQRWVSRIKNGANNYRFALYRDWLRARAQTVRRVMITDVSDVVFQSDPFRADACFPEADATASSVFFTLENGDRANFKSEAHNRRWMTCFGSAILRRLEAQRSVVSCAGVTFGLTAGVIEYCDALLLLVAEPAIMECSELKIRAALDQAAHNVLLYASHANFTRRVAPRSCTFHGGYGVSVWDERGGVIVPAAGAAPYAVVHQYTDDRVPRMMALAKDKWGR